MNIDTIVTWIGIGLAFFILTMIAFVDVMYKQFESREKKIMWGLIALIPFIGCIIYFIFGIRKGKRLKKESTQ